MKYLIFLALSFLSVSASAFNPVDCSNPRNEVQLYVCQDAQLSELNNQSIVLETDKSNADGFVVENAGDDESQVVVFFSRKSEE